MSADLTQLDASDLIRLVSHSLQASSWRTGLPDTLSKREKTQRAAGLQWADNYVSSKYVAYVQHTVCVWYLTTWE